MQTIRVYGTIILHAIFEYYSSYPSCMLWISSLTHNNSLSAERYAADTGIYL